MTPLKAGSFAGNWIAVDSTTASKVESLEVTVSSTD